MIYCGTAENTDFKSGILNIITEQLIIRLISHSYCTVNNQPPIKTRNKTNQNINTSLKDSTAFTFLKSGSSFFNEILDVKIVPVNVECILIPVSTYILPKKKLFMLKTVHQYLAWIIGFK